MHYRFLVNINTHEVHDLWDERNGCRIDEIDSSHRRYFRNNSIVSLSAWLRDNPEFNGCCWCLAEYHIPEPVG